jgi:trk system potassium uptake protein TrkA
VDLFIAVTDQDEVNLVACLLAHERGSRRIIARIKGLEYTTAEWAQNARKLGIDLLINPQKVVAEEIHRIVYYTAASEAAEFADGRVVFLGYMIGRDSPMKGITLKRLAGVRAMYRMVVTAIARKHETIIPRGEDTMQEGDIVYFVCNKRDVPAIDYLFEFEKQPSKTVFILGGGHLGASLARKLVGARIRVKLIEQDPELCQALAEELEDVIVLNTEGTDIDTLKHEGIDGCDAYVAVTDSEETNILCSLLAKSHGAKRAIAIVDRHEFVTLAPSLGVDACISPRLVTASAVLKYVRPSGVASLATIEHSNAEVLEIALPSQSPILGRPLKEIDMPEGALIGIVVRGEDVVIPDGEDHLEAGDHVIVFTLPEAISRVERFFS